MKGVWYRCQAKGVLLLIPVMFKTNILVPRRDEELEAKGSQALAQNPTVSPRAVISPQDCLTLKLVLLSQ